jgi:hypothetical protein
MGETMKNAFNTYLNADNGEPVPALVQEYLHWNTAGGYGTAAILLLVVVVFVFVMRYSIRKLSDTKEDNSEFVIGCILSAAGIGVCGSFCVSNTYYATKAVVAPRVVIYEALKADER